MTFEPLEVLPDLHDFTRAELDVVLRWLRQRCDVLAYERLQILCLTAAKDESSLPEEDRERLENLRTEESAARRCIIAVKLEEIRPMTPSMPPVKEGTKADLYIKACHKRIWALARIINPGVTGDCLEVADKIIKEKKNDKV